jgi:hypothetical protein
MRNWSSRREGANFSSAPALSGFGSASYPASYCLDLWLARSAPEPNGNAPATDLSSACQIPVLKSNCAAYTLGTLMLAARNRGDFHAARSHRRQRSTAVEHPSLSRAPATSHSQIGCERRQNSMQDRESGYSGKEMKATRSTAWLLAECESTPSESRGRKCS